MAWTVETLDGRVDREIKALPKDIQADLVHISELIETHGLRDVGMPHVHHVEGKLWEIRASGKSGQGRGIYKTAKGKRVIILVAFNKKTGTTPRKILDLANVRAKEAI